ncbi:MAG: DNA cytosine methyltransferase [Candidatus Binatia bacterium]
MRVKRKPTALDLFCGCGGISCGLRMAGFEILAGVDTDPKYMATFSRNFPEAKSLQIDLSAISPAEFAGSLGIKAEELDLLAGGPPCQGFSKNVPRKFRFLGDPNNLCIKTFLDYCEFLKPLLILMENVAEMKNGFDQAYAEEILSRLGEAGYTVTHAVLNSADYGVPQRRRRAFFLASRGGIRLDVPPPTHARPSGQIDLLSTPSHVIVWEAIGDLPSLEHGDGYDYSEYASPPFSAFQELMRNEQTRVANHVARRLQPMQYQRLAHLKPGESHKDLPRSLRVRGGYSGAYGRLTKDMVAPTITRWVFHPGSGRWGHPVDIRVLSIREVARIQSFPDSFEFVGTYTQQAGQLGNAVPPLLVRRIAESMLAQAGASRRDKSLRSPSRGTFSASVGKLKVTV